MLVTFHPEALPLREVAKALRLGTSHVTLETVLWAFQDGSTPESIVDEYPTLALADVYAVIAYYLRHRDDVDRYLGARADAYWSTVETIRRDFPQPAFLDRRRARTTRG